MISVILLTLNEAELVCQRITEIQSLAPDVQIIAADGGSQDGTPQLAANLGARVVQSGPGRGCQCRAGAEAAQGDILLFLHADSCLPADAFQVLDQAFSDPRLQIGAFRLRFDHPHPVLRLYASFSRFDTLITRFGDQGIAVRRSFYHALGGFPDWPLFEDVEFLRRARRHGPVASFPTCITTSARRYLQNGVIRQQLHNLGLMLQYLSGVSPYVLAQRYSRKAER
jgi:rSAM/selenodomain-associated transferase 2